jgi:phage FluMu protein gp41
VTFEEWKEAVAAGLAKMYGETLQWARDYVRDVGDECWREHFDDELTPDDMIDAEADAARWAAS